MKEEVGEGGTEKRMERTPILNSVPAISVIFERHGVGFEGGGTFLVVGGWTKLKSLRPSHFQPSFIPVVVILLHPLPSPT